MQIFTHNLRSLELDFIHVIDEVGEAHEGGRALVLREIRADSARVATSTCVQKNTEVIVIDLFGVTADLSQELLHIDRELELLFDYLDQRFLAHEALLVRLTTQANETVQIFVGLVFLLSLQLNLLEISQCSKQCLHIDSCRASLIQKFVELCNPLVRQIVAASYRCKNRVSINDREEFMAKMIG